MTHQPDPSTIAYGHRYYQTLVADLNLKKRTSWFDFPNSEKTVPKVAVVECSGVCPAIPGVDGNCKDNLGKPYVQTNTEHMCRKWYLWKENRPVSF